MTPLPGLRVCAMDARDPSMDEMNKEEKRKTKEKKVK